MPARRLPTAVLEARGAFRKNPDRGRARESEPKGTTPLGEPPARLSAKEKEAWEELAANTHEGVLCSADRFLLEMVARLLAESWEQRTSFPIRKINQLAALLGRLGMTPSDRSRVQAAPSKQPDSKRGRFSALRARRTA